MFTHEDVVSAHANEMRIVDRFDFARSCFVAEIDAEHDEYSLDGIEQTDPDHVMFGTALLKLVDCFDIDRYRTFARGFGTEM